MHILIGLGLAVVLLYFWLIGHWFARVLVFLILAVLGAILGLWALLASTGITPPSPAYGIVGIVGVCLGVVAAWFVSGIPVYYWRHQLRTLG